MKKFLFWMLLLAVSGCSTTQKTTQNYTNKQVDLKNTPSVYLSGLIPENLKFESLIDVKAPEFPGGQKALSRWQLRNISYPAKAERNGIEGVVQVHFSIGENGKVKDIKVIKSSNDLLDEEVLRLIQSMPDWTPAEKNGVKISYPFTEEITFQMKIDNYEKWKTYTGSQYERTVVVGFSQSLDSGNNLTDDQKKNLTDLMYKERQDAFAEMNFHASSTNKETVAERIKRMEEIDGRVVKKAASILSATQLEQFSNYLKAYRERIEISLSSSK
jgi:TonB family protein